MLGYVSSSSSGNQILDVLQCLKMVRWESVHLKVFVSQEILLKSKRWISSVPAMQNFASFSSQLDLSLSCCCWLWLNQSVEFLM